MAAKAHEHRLRVRYAETDQMGVVHHANYLVYFEESRTSLMRDRGCSYAELERQGWALPVRRIEIRYRAPAYYEEELLVRTSVGRVGNASITFESEVVRPADDVTVATGWVELACVRKDATTRRPVPLPPELLERLAGFQDAADGPSGSS
jgi:acyl-CoA thioester hydrolase